MFPEDINTSGSWDLIDPMCDAEVAGITGEQNQQPVDQPVNTSYDSTQVNPNQGLPQVNQGGLNNTQELCTNRISLSQTQQAEG